MSRLVLVSTICLSLSINSLVSAQVKRPKPPDRFDVKVLYRIDAFRNTRAILFRQMLRYFESLGFQRDPNDLKFGQAQRELTNSGVFHIEGTIPADNVDKLARSPQVNLVQIKPAGSELPVDDEMVRAEMKLADRLSRGQRDILYAQLLHILKKIGFRPAIGYDHQDFSRIVGQLPVKSIPAIMTVKTAPDVYGDIRLSPSSWSLLPSDLLVQMREKELGKAFLVSLLERWQEIPEGIKLLKDAVAAWREETAAQALIAKLPRNVLRFPLIVEEQLLQQMAFHPAGAPYLEDLFKNVLASPKGPLLMSPLFNRLQTVQLESLLPLYFRGKSPIQVLELRPDIPLPSPVPPAEVVPADHLKLSPAVRRLLKDKAEADKPRRFEVLLDSVPGEQDRLWERLMIRAVPSIDIEGRIGSLVTIKAKASEMPFLTAVQKVTSIRLPRAAKSNVLTFSQAKGNSEKILQKTGVDLLHRKGHRGKGVRVAIVSNDFRGWNTLVGKELPKDTRLVDLTIERNPDLLPDPFSGPLTELGTGTQLARAVRLAAPDAEITLIRFDSGSPALLKVALRYLNGSPIVSESLRERTTQLERERLTLNRREDALNRERVRVLSLFADDRPQTDVFEKERQTLRDAYFRKQEQYEKDRSAFEDAVARYLSYRSTLGQLKEVNIVVSDQTWETGHPADSSDALTRFLDTELSDSILWVQAGGSTENQVWTGLSRDEDKDGIMEFGSMAKLPKDSWTNELNFLAWQPNDSDEVINIPAGTTVRVAVQWEEAHDPRYIARGEDPYRVPLNRFDLMILQQLDPTGEKRPADDMSVIAQTSGIPQRIKNLPTVAIYEQVVEFSVPTAGRYAIRMTGDIHRGAQPRNSSTLPSAMVMNEIQPRIITEVLQGNGRVVMDDYRSQNADIPTPAESCKSIVVGALDSAGKPQPYTATGAPYGLGLAQRPQFFFEDRLGLTGAEKLGGSGMSAAFTAGLAATLWSADQQPDQICQSLSLISKRLLADTKK